MVSFLGEQKHRWRGLSDGIELTRESALAFNVGFGGDQLVGGTCRQLDAGQNCGCR